MIIKLRSNVDRTRAIVYYVDEACGARVARESGIVLAREKLDASGAHVWRLAVKSEPVAPPDVIAFYERIPFGVAVDSSGSSTEAPKGGA